MPSFPLNIAGGLDALHPDSFRIPPFAPAVVAMLETVERADLMGLTKRLEQPHDRLEVVNGE